MFLNVIDRLNKNSRLYFLQSFLKVTLSTLALFTLSLSFFYFMFDSFSFAWDLFTFYSLQNSLNDGFLHNIALSRDHLYHDILYFSSLNFIFTSSHYFAIIACSLVSFKVFDKLKKIKLLMSFIVSYYILAFIPTFLFSLGHSAVSSHYLFNDIYVFFKKTISFVTNQFSFFDPLLENAPIFLFLILFILILFAFSFLILKIRTQLINSFIQLEKAREVGSKTKIMTLSFFDNELLISNLFKSSSLKYLSTKYVFSRNKNQIIINLANKNNDLIKNENTNIEITNC